VRLRCSGHLPPSFIDFVITRGHASGVIIAGCRPGDCHYRLGGQWARERFAATRDPRLRARVPHERFVQVWSGIAGKRELERALKQLQARLAGLGLYRRAEAAPAQTAVDNA
jgi:coenzyme F420-reducing hydrogenase delta subunit